MSWPGRQKPQDRWASTSGGPWGFAFTPALRTPALPAHRALLTEQRGSGVRPGGAETVCFSLEGIFLSPEIHGSRLRPCHLACPLVVPLPPSIKAQRRCPAPLTSTDPGLLPPVWPQPPLPARTSTLLHPAGLSRAPFGSSHGPFTQGKPCASPASPGLVLSPLLCPHLRSHTASFTERPPLDLCSPDTCPVVMSHGPIRFPVT